MFQLEIESRLDTVVDDVLLECQLKKQIYTMLIRAYIITIAAVEATREDNSIIVALTVAYRAQYSMEEETAATITHFRFTLD